MRQQAFCVGNALTPYFTWTGGTATRKDALRDGRLDAYAFLPVGVAAGDVWEGEIQADMGATRTLNFIALLGHDVYAKGGTLGVRASPNTFAWTTLKAPTTPMGRDTLLAFPDASFRYFNLSVTLPLSTTMVATEVVLGMAKANTRGIVWGQSQTESFTVASFVSDAGAAEVRFRAGPVSSLELSYEDLSLAEGDEVTDMWAATRGGQKPLLWAPNWLPTSGAATPEAQECLWGRLQESMEWRYDDVGRATPSGLSLVGLSRGAGQ